MLGLLAIALAGFGGAPQAQAQAEPQTIGAVSNLAARADGQPAGTVRVSWDAADNAQTHFVVYLKSTDAAAGSYAGARMAAFSGANGVIGGLEPGTAYSFIVIGMRWNWVNYGAVWGQWSDWAAATPSGTAGPPAAAVTPAAEPQTVGRVTGLAVSTEGQPAGTVRVSWDAADNAQTHFIAYVDAAAGNYAGAQMAAFSGAGGVISGLKPGTAYNFIAIGMRWNWGNYGAVWGQWSDWAAATPGAGSAASDRAALVALYHATNGPNWRYSDNWLSDAPLNEWHGVTTDHNGRVIRLELDRNGLRGAIPPELGNLARLQRLDLEANQLKGPLPPELGGLASLQHLDLSGSRLKGAIPPELGNLANLEWLDLSFNSLAGAIPPELRSLANLEHLNLDNNPLTGAIPPELGNLASLRHLNLSSSWLTGVIPPELGNLANLEHLDLNNIRLGSIPPPPLPGNLPNLQVLNSGVNQLTGAIPPELGNLANLKRLHLYGNELTGAIPPELGNLANLEELLLGGNQLTGAIPPELGNLANLEWLSLGNRLTGAIPPELGNLANLRHLSLSRNRLTGTIPPELGNLANLRWLYLSHNRLTGCIPVALRNVPEHDLSRTVVPFCDRVGVTLAAADRAVLTALYNAAGGASWIHNENWLSDAPKWYGVNIDDNGHVVRLDLARNWLTGELPPELGNLANLEHLSLSQNWLTGRIPAELGNLTNLRRLELDWNSLTGEIPAELGNLANLEYLHFSYNELTGEIPAELGNLANLRRS